MPSGHQVRRRSDKLKLKLKQMIDPEYVSTFVSGALTGTAILLAAIVLLWVIEVSRLRSYSAPVAAPLTVARPEDD